MNTQPIGASIADLHERLGELIADGSGRIEGMEGRAWNTRQTHLRGLQIDNYIRTIEVPELPATPFLQALQADWDEDTRLLGEAYESYQQHRDRARYRRECNEIIGRNDGLEQLSGETIDV